MILRALRLHKLRKIIQSDEALQPYLSCKHMIFTNDHTITDFNQRIEHLACVRDHIISAGYEWDFQGIGLAARKNVISMDEFATVIWNALDEVLQL